MNLSKEDFFNQLQFELGDRWPELESDSILTINQLADFIIERSKLNAWHFLRFLPYYLKAQAFLLNRMQNKINPDFDLNKLSQEDKVAFLSFTKAEFGSPLTFQRPKTLNTIVFIFPIFFILLPLLLSTYLITAKSYSGWLYLSGLIGLILSISLFSITKQFKNKFAPSALIEYAKSFYVIHNQEMNTDPTRAQLVDFICQVAKSYYKTDFKADSIIPEG